MADRPILFSAPMVRSILAGSKTQTRRVLKPQPDASFIGATITPETLAFKPAYLYGTPTHDALLRLYKPGYRLWVRESIIKTPAGIAYAADGNDHYGAGGKLRATPSIHMPRWASRITLRVDTVKVERLQDISEADAIAEGIEDVTREISPRDPSFRFWKRYRDGGWNGYVDCPIGSFASLWTEINGPGSWEANPWVAAYSFKPIFQNIDKIEAQP